MIVSHNMRSRAQDGSRGAPRAPVTSSSGDKAGVLIGRGHDGIGRILLMPPLDLTEEELVTAAMACRARAHQEMERVKVAENPMIRHQIERTARRLAGLAEKFEAARAQARPSGRYTR